MEQLYPVLFEEYSLHEGSGGAGEHRGGFGVNYRIRLRRGDARVSMVMDHGRAGPPGAQGGGAGGTNKVAIDPRRRGLRAAAPLQGPGHRDPRRRRDRRLDAGRRRLRRARGARPRAAVERDVALGYYGADEARAAPFGRAQGRRHERLSLRIADVGAGRSGARCRAPAPTSARIDATSGWCEGCLRTIDEIAAWGSLDDAREARDLETPAAAGVRPLRGRRGDTT